ncbi:MULTISPECIES: serine hydrolase [Streptomycetaceae]|uniref:Beta-lactamase class A-like protein n=1 Tax=Streptantibioticus cattleyicolor (strain ATCC 35852 / DSM 46488 / JCM 4925 / NBRC 14057 / NRRL 8057) TaxID=1003195 RepID=F8JWX7_STREN|nr:MULTISPECIES: serine hydrolase [Streptomycetaceae]AEW93178.1 beta-lactamase class A-like protein [Streptantibioticus cattleyicolor NRRL 8057 = DSM 46488]MYS57903.1 serine hydrolase [Streptomyces sp. SID5468]CCB73539.1 Beta-lactamase [Streptantibioticus cattleyicolor NRRL 8057 = DSM 46488]
MLSVVAGPWRGEPVVRRNADVVHEAASTMKVAVLTALHRSGMDPELAVPVTGEFGSAAGGTYRIDRAADSDPVPWRRLGGTAPLGWLAERMIAHSSNLAANLCLAQVGPAAVAEVWRAAGATRSVTARGIEDLRGRAAGAHNRVTAADLARLLSSLEPRTLRLLERNTWRVDLAAGLPPGTRIAFKNGWFPGVRHCAAVIRPGDAEPYVLVVCYTGPLASGDDVADPAAGLLARISARAWRRRHELAAGARPRP